MTERIKFRLDSGTWLVLHFIEDRFTHALVQSKAGKSITLTPSDLQQFIAAAAQALRKSEETSQGPADSPASS